MDEYKSDIVKAEEVKITDVPEVQADIAKAMNEVNADWDALKKQEKDKFIEGHKVTLEDDDLTIFKRPRSGCKHCYGRGVKGFYDASSKTLPLEPTLCQCLTNRMVIRGEMPDTKDRMSYGEFRDIIAKAKRVYNLEGDKNEQTNGVYEPAVQSSDQGIDTSKDQS